MQVILQEKVDSLGEPFEIVNVKEGYARNFLIPKKLAMVATPSNVSRIEILKKQRSRKQEKAQQQAEAAAKKLEDISLTIAVKVGEEDKMFGSVNSQQIYTALKKEGIDQISKKMIELEEPIKTLGIYNVPIKLHPGVSGTIKVWVVKE